MRALALASALAFLATGCVVPGVVQNDAPALPALGAVDVPGGAALETIEGGVRLVWENVELPFREEFTVPEGATMVRARGVVGEGATVLPALYHAETMRRRCQTPNLEAWNLPVRSDSTCTALTAVDDLPATWLVVMNGFAPFGGTLGGAPAVAELVAIDLVAAPLEGPASKLDLAKLSKPAYDMLETEVVKVKSHDGTLLHVELTRPDAEAKVPAVIISSPYNDATRKAGLRPNDDVVKDWGARGYAIVVADVRGFGDSGGCVEVWGINEQKDQKALVDWVAAQEWSDGAVGFYGQSYVGTTPVEAAVQAPEALKAIITIAPVISAYDDWHFGGVSNGENAASPVVYQQLGTGATLDAQDPLTSALNVANGVCDPTLAARANDPREVYDDFYAERNFSARAKDVRAAVLYTQGFHDSNVKSAMIDPWFNALTVPKLGLFGHWIHQHPVRADQETLFLAWLDEYVKGKPLGFENVAPVDITLPDGARREAWAWPPTDGAEVRLFADFKERALASAPVEGYSTLQLEGVGLPVELPGKTTLVALSMPVNASTRLAGQARVALNAHVEYGANGYLAAFLYDKGDTTRLVTWGMLNLAHRHGHDKYEPLSPGEMFVADLPMLPTEHVFEAGHELILEIRGAHVTDWAAVAPTQPAELGLHGGEGGVALVLPLA